MTRLTYERLQHRVTLPTFVLEPRSMLERITDFMAHPELILPYVIFNLVTSFCVTLTHIVVITIVGFPILKTTRKDSLQS